MRPDPQHETRDLDTRIVLWIAIGLPVAGVAVHFVMVGILAGLTALHGAPSPVGAVPASPPIWVNEVGRRLEDDARTRRDATTYGRTDGHLRIPVDRAMELLLARGHAWTPGDLDPTRWQQLPQDHLNEPTPTPPPPAGGRP